MKAEGQITASSTAIRAELVGTAQEQDLIDVIAATLVSRYNNHSFFQLCAMGSNRR